MKAKLTNTMIRLSKPMLGSDEEKAVIHVLRSGQIAQGAWVDEFERQFAKYIKIPFAVAVNNGTSALIAALLATGIGRNDEVITTPVTFGATANSILAVGAKVKFVDIDPDSYCLNTQTLNSAINRKTKAVIGVDLFGHCADWLNIKKIAQTKGLVAIEDAAQAHGATIGKVQAGCFGKIATFSFYATKNMTTAEGGMIVTRDKTIYERLLLLRNHGMEKKYSYKSLGFNLRMTNIQAALGIVQLKKLETLNKKRIAHAQLLSSLLTSVPGIITPLTRDKSKHVFHQYVIRVTKDYSLSRDQLASYLNVHGVETGIHYPIPLHRFPLYKYRGRKLPMAEIFCQQTLSLPVHPALTNKQLQFIADLIQNHN